MVLKLFPWIAKSAKWVAGHWRRDLTPKNLLVVLVVSVFMFGINHYEVLDSWERFVFDSFLKYRPDPKAQEKIVVVRITDENYEEYFCNTSPLDANVLKQLILNIAKQQPAVIGIDLDVNIPDLQAKLVAELDKLGDRKPTIVWAQLTQKAPDLKRPQSNTLGVPMFPRDSDGVVRRYLRCIEAGTLTQPSDPAPKQAGVETLPQPSICDVDKGKERSGPYLPTLSWAVLKAARAVKAEQRDDSKKRIFSILQYEDDFALLGAEQFLPDPLVFHPDAAHCQESRITYPVEERQNSTQLQGKMVLLGGAYNAARDKYFTPVGERTGVELIAQAMQSDMSKKGLLDFDARWGLLVDIGLGIFLLILHSLLHESKWVNSLTAAIGLIVPLLISIWLFRTFAMWLSFVPVLVATVINVIHDRLEAQSKIIEELRSKLKRYEEQAE